jgi:hypothetical protein
LHPVPPLEDTAVPKTLVDAKSKVVRDIVAVVRPLLRPSGFTVGPIGCSRPLMLCSYPKPEEPADTFVATTVYGFTSTGVITDAAGGACVVEDFESLPIEDLFALRLLLRTRSLPE